jgi:peptide chain release factor
MIRLHFTSGRGPAECRIALRLALGRLEREAAERGISCDVSTAGDNEHGPASALVLLSADDDLAMADVLANAWTGSILWVCPSAVRPNHRRKNWFIGATRLAALAEAPKTLRTEDIRFTALRAGGPGGQHQNKTESAIRALHAPSGRSVVVRDGRSQHQNKSLAVRRLAALIAGDAELAVLAEAERRQTNHDSLERGRPVRTFRGPKFDAD